MKDFTKIINQKLEPEIRYHLKNVYTTFTIATLLVTVGGYVGVIYDGFLIISLCGSLMTIILLIMTPYQSKNLRLILFGLFTFFKGYNLGPYLQTAIRIDPAIIIQALLITIIVFTCFSLSALVAPHGKYLLLGGILSSIFFNLVYLSMMNIFLGSQLLFKVNIYIGLFVMCGFILYDTQKIIEKVRMGDKDYIMHAVMLLVDFVNIFRYLLLILIDKNKNNKNSNNKIYKNNKKCKI